MPRTKTFKPKIKKVYNEDQRNLLLESLNYYFYNNSDVLEKIYNLITDNTKITMALIDFFVTTYSKINKSGLNLDTDEPFYINHNYKQQLKSFSKNNFEPFKRNSRTIIYKREDMIFETTVPQLNFLKWAVTKNIIKYIEDNFEDIIVEYKKFCNKKNKKNKKTN